ncbi:hypothetical protein QFZ56_004516 [Streptomyces achromogenes]|uniref:Uncharacterized protein n=1 Tax=Streptomyces achromogenes TaxID=67255 RepID=A0ABU0Q4G3_STRAH|nr:hypothetical protein [Streptomyces achromogenes]
MRPRRGGEAGGGRGPGVGEDGAGRTRPGRNGVHEPDVVALDFPRPPRDIPGPRAFRLGWSGHDRIPVPKTPAGRRRRCRARCCHGDATGRPRRRPAAPRHVRRRRGRLRRGRDDRRADRGPAGTELCGRREGGHLRGLGRPVRRRYLDPEQPGDPRRGRPRHPRESRRLPRRGRRPGGPRRPAARLPRTRSGDDHLRHGPQPAALPVDGGLQRLLPRAARRSPERPLRRARPARRQPPRRRPGPPQPVVPPGPGRGGWWSSAPTTSGST